MRPFRERDPVVIGVLGIVVIILMLTAAFRADRLPVIGGGDTYYAAFTEAGGLQANDEVRLAGVRIGKVQEVTLTGGQVLVKFVVDEPATFGELTRADIKVKTILGSMQLSLDADGPGQLETSEDNPIPISRTTAPFDVVDAFEGLAGTIDEIDTDQLADALDTLADLGRNTPEELRSALKGVSAVSRTVAAKDNELNSLLVNLGKVAGVLDARGEDIVALMQESDVLFQALVQRRQSISDLLDATSQLSRELTLLVRETRDDLKPMLDNLEGVVDVLLRNRANLDEGLRLAAPFYRVFANTLGTGPWFDTFIYNFPPIAGPAG